VAELLTPLRRRTLTGKLLAVQWPLLLMASALAAIGTAMLVSVAGGSLQPWAESHALRFLIGLALVLAMTLVPLSVWMRAAYPAFAAGLVLLALVPLAGSEALGARRWLSLGGFSLQPSEIVKVALVAALARYFHDLPAARISSPRALLIPAAMILAPVVLTLRQPDLGTSLLLAATGLTLMFLAGVSSYYFLGGAVAAFAALPLVLSRLHGYQRRRLEVFLDPDKDPLGAGYHIAQAKIALGSGGLSGKGFMQGTQAQLDFVPEKHTDFILAIIGEEWGFVGTLSVLLLLAALTGTALAMARRAETTFARLVIAGFALMVLVYAVINIAMVTGVAPVVGVPLPLVSYGGTNMMSLMAAMGLAMSAHVHGHERL
jgi:rod shape determining protein RodA